MSTETTMESTPLEAPELEDEGPGDEEGEVLELTDEGEETEEKEGANVPPSRLSELIIGDDDR